MDNIVISAPAKLNLFLKVLGRRPDGYHTIETLFEKIALFDKIKLKKSSGTISLHSDKEGLPKEKENLAYRAAKLLKDRHGISLGVDIEIEKYIPIGAGLGGGSSDAASVLIGINRLYDIGLFEKELILLGGELGADVPLFISDKIWAIGRERGDKIESIDTQMKLWHIIIIPPHSILSKDAYKWVDRVEKKKDVAINNVISALRENDIRSLAKGMHNDLEGIALERVIQIKELKTRLVKYGAEGTLVTGSGPAIFGIFKDKEEVINVKEHLEGQMHKEDGKWEILVVPTLESNKARTCGTK